MKLGGDLPPGHDALLLVCPMAGHTKAFDQAVMDHRKGGTLLSKFSKTSKTDDSLTLISTYLINSN